MRAALACLLLLAAVGAPAQNARGAQGAQGSEGSTEGSREAAALIGLGLAEIFARLGAPAEVLAVRGPSADQDDVVFYYPQHLYLFWFQNRVWQVRYDRRHAGDPFCLRMGFSRQRVTEVLGEPLRELTDAPGAPGEAGAAGTPPQALVYQLEDRGYPVRLRLYFEQDRLVDLYCYRADL